MKTWPKFLFSNKNLVLERVQFSGYDQAIIAHPYFLVVLALSKIFISAFNINELEICQGCFLGGLNFFSTSNKSQCLIIHMFFKCIIFISHFLYSPAIYSDFMDITLSSVKYFVLECCWFTNVSIRILFQVTTAYFLNLKNCNVEQKKS